jgi:hypothetical protein
MCYQTVDRGNFLSTSCQLELELILISDREKGFSVVNSMLIETGAECDITHGKWGFMLSEACKLKL